MKKIEQGMFEIFTSKADAINKFMQMQGVCREELSSENLIEFYCSKKGKISITNPPPRKVDKCDYTKGYWQIDLDTPQQIDKIEIDARKNYPRLSVWIDSHLLTIK